MDSKIYVDDISNLIDDILEMEYDIKSCNWSMGFDPDDGAYIKTSDVVLHTDQMDYQPLIDTENEDDLSSDSTIFFGVSDELINRFYEHLMQPIPTGIGFRDYDNYEINVYDDSYVIGDCEKDDDDVDYKTYQDSSGNVIVVVIKDQ